MKEIVFIIHNTFFETEIGTMVLPYNKIMAMTGFYSELWKELRIEMANIERCDKHFIRLQFKVVPSRAGRTTISLPSGTKLDMPSIFDMTKTDWKIIGLQMESAKLAMSK